MGGGSELPGGYVGALQSSFPWGTESWPQALLLAAKSSMGVGGKKAVVWWGKKLSRCFRDTNAGCWAGCGDVPWGRQGVVRGTNLRWEVPELGVKLVLQSTEGCDFCVPLMLDSVLTGWSGSSRSFMTEFRREKKNIQFSVTAFATEKLPLSLKS